MTSPIADACICYGALLRMYNPSHHKLEEQFVEEAPGRIVRINEYYYVPEMEDWWSVFPNIFQIRWDNPNPRNVSDYARLKVSDSFVRVLGNSSYTDPIQQGGDVVVYALRFVKATPGSSPRVENWYGAPSTTYTPLTDNKMVMGYRYTRVGLHGSDNMTSHLKVECIYLGEEGYEALPTKDAEGVKAIWGNYQASVRLFPNVGYYNPNTSNPFGVSNYLNGIGGLCYYWSTSRSDIDYSLVVHSGSDYFGSLRPQWCRLGIPVRLFYK